MTDAGAATRQDRQFCVTDAGIRGWCAFLADVAGACRRMQGYDAICNMATGRYDFAVGLAAAMLNGQTTVLPPSRAARAVEAAIAGFAAPLIFGSVEQLAPVPPLPDGGGEALAERLSAATSDVLVFTSGSTGTPVRHRKSWAILAGGARLTAELIARAGLDPARCLVVGTTPHQHMYGLEATMFAGLAHGCCLYDLPVFYPADIEAAAARAAALGIADLVLVTSPPHLKFLEDAVRRTPQVRCVISATAPLHAEMARRLEAGGARKVFEIYGCTEAGSLAWRRTVEQALWTPMEGFRLSACGDGWVAEAPYLDGPAELADEIELQSDGRFRLLGRRGDMVSIAGKRQSLGALNAILASMPGLRDGVMIRETVDGEDRWSVVAVPDDPAVDPAALRSAVRAHLRAHVDPVFVPRAIAIVDFLPRGATGKITARDLAALAAGVSGERHP